MNRSLTVGSEMQNGVALQTLKLRLSGWKSQPLTYLFRRAKIFLSEEHFGAFCRNWKQLKFISNYSKILE